LRNGLTLEDLRLIRAIATAGTLTGAARHLKVDHSTAFRRLGAVESRVGSKLFERARDGYTPTPAGEAALATAQPILDDLATLERRLAGEDLRPTGTVRMTTTDTLIDLVAPAFSEMRRVHPGILVELVVANTFLTLTKRDADIALRPAAVAPEQLAGRKLASVATAPYASPAYLAGHGKAALARHSWIGFDESLGHLRSARWLAATVPAAQVVFKADSLMGLRAAARAGIGVAAMPCYLGDPDPGLKRLAPPLPDMEVSMWLLTHPDLRRVARVRSVLDIVAATIARQRALIEGRWRARGPARR
jgi:DNA-binding transcriptional LysR family regulator